MNDGVSDTAGKPALRRALGCGMAIAILATLLSTFVTDYVVLVITMVLGAGAGLYVASKVQMTEMPELVAILHSFVGLAAVLIGYANYLDHGAALHGVEKTIHEVEIYLGILIGAVTFTGSIIAFGKLRGQIDGKPVLLPARHWLNLGLGILCFWLGSIFVGNESTAGGVWALILERARRADLRAPSGARKTPFARPLADRAEVYDLAEMDSDIGVSSSRITGA